MTKNKLIVANCYWLVSGEISCRCSCPDCQGDHDSVTVYAVPTKGIDEKNAADWVLSRFEGPYYGYWKSEPVVIPAPQALIMELQGYQPLFDLPPRRHPTQRNKPILYRNPWYQEWQKHKAQVKNAQI